jgi:acid phosphatase
VKRHNPFAYFSDVLNDPAQAARMVPYTQFASDLAAGTLPDFVYLLPNQINNMHDCPVSNCTKADKLRAGDAWLQANVPAILNSPAFHENSVLIFTMDEGEHSDPRNGGGRIITLFIGPKAKVNHRSSTFYQHENLLRYMLDRWEISDRPGASAGAASMDEFER